MKAKIRMFFSEFAWKKTIVLLILGIVISVAVLIAKGFSLIINYCDAFFISGFIILALGILSILSYFGAFDTMGYSIYAFAHAFNKKEKITNRKYVDLVDYVEKKKTKRGELKGIVLPYIIVGGLFVLLFFILLIVA